MTTPRLLAEKIAMAVGTYHEIKTVEEMLTAFQGEVEKNHMRHVSAFAFEAGYTDGLEESVKIVEDYAKKWGTSFHPEFKGTVIIQAIKSLAGRK